MYIDTSAMSSDLQEAAPGTETLAYNSVSEQPQIEEIDDETASVEISERVTTIPTVTEPGVSGASLYGGMFNGVNPALTHESTEADKTADASGPPTKQAEPPHIQGKYCKYSLSSDNKQRAKYYLIPRDKIQVKIIPHSHFTPNDPLKIQKLPNFHVFTLAVETILQSSDVENQNINTLMRNVSNKLYTLYMTSIFGNEFLAEIKTEDIKKDGIAARKQIFEDVNNKIINPFNKYIKNQQSSWFIQSLSEAEQFRLEESNKLVADIYYSLIGKKNEDTIEKGLLETISAQLQQENENIKKELFKCCF